MVLVAVLGGLLGTCGAVGGLALLSALRIEIAPGSGGDVFATVLGDAWRKHHPEARIENAKR